MTIAAEKAHVQGHRLPQPGDEAIDAVAGRSPITPPATNTPAAERFVMALDHRQNGRVGDILGGELPREDGVIIGRRAGQSRVNPILERVMNQGDQPQRITFARKRREAFDIGKDIPDMVDDFALAVARTRFTPGGAFKPAWVSTDTVFKVGFKCKR